MGLEMFHEAQELLMLVVGAALRQHRAIDDVGCREQRGRAVPHIIVCHPLDITESERRDRLGPLQRLDLRFLIDAEHDRMIGRIEIETEDFLRLVDEQRIGRKFEATGAVRLHAEQSQHARRRAFV